MPVCRWNPTALSPQFISTPPLFISLLFISSGHLWAIWSSEKMNQSVKLLTQTSRTTFFSVFAASFMIHSHSVSTCTNRYVAFWWFTGIINKWILNSSVIHFAATADVRFLRLPSCTRGCQIHQECRILILTPNRHPHTGTQGAKTKPSQPALDVSFSLDTIQTPLRCVLWKKRSISEDFGWLTLHIERPLAVGPLLDTAACEDVTLYRVSAHSQHSPSASFPRGSRLPRSPSETLC